MIKLNNFDDIAKKYRDEILKLYKNQNQNMNYDTDNYGQQYIPSFPEDMDLMDMPEEENNNIIDTEINSSNTNENNNGNQNNSTDSNYINPNNGMNSNYMNENNYVSPNNNTDEPVPVIPMPPAVKDSSEMYNKSRDNNTGIGFLKVMVSSGDNAYPVEGALVIVTQMANGMEGIIKILETNRNGETVVIELPAPLEKGTKVSSGKPYFYYNVIVFAERHYEVQNKNVAIFNGITSIQPVNLIPVPAYTDEKRVMTFYKQETDL